MSKKQIQRHFDEGGEGGATSYAHETTAYAAPSADTTSAAPVNTTTLAGLAAAGAGAGGDYRGMDPGVTVGNPVSAQQDSDQQAAASMGMSLDAYRAIAYGPGEAPALDRGTGNGSAVTPGGSWSQGTDGRTYGNLQDAARDLGVKPSTLNSGDSNLPGYLGMIAKAAGWLQDQGLPGYAMTPEERQAAQEAGQFGSHGTPESARPFAAAPAQTTDQKKVDAASGAGAAGTGMPHYVWDPVAGRYTLTKAGSGSAAIGATEGVQPSMYGTAADLVASGGRSPVAMAAGGPVHGGLQAAATHPRYMKGPGDGQSDDIPVKMSDGGQGFLADNEFVVPADAVSALGSGSSDAGARAMYAMVDRIRQQAHGHTQQAKPVDPSKVLPA